MGTKIFKITGMSCVNCSLNIEKKLKGLRGVENVSVSFVNNNMIIVFDDKILSIDEIKKKVKLIGYGIELMENKIEEDKNNNKEIVYIIISFLFTLIVLYFSMGSMFGLPFTNIDTYYLQLFLIIPILIINKKIYVQGIRALFSRNSNMFSLVSVSTISAIIYSIISKENIYFESIAVILSLVSLGKYFENKIKNNATKSITKLLNLTPKVSLVKKEDKEFLKSSSDLEIGDIVIIKSGETIPTDGKIVRGRAYIDESIITGESELILKEVGDDVIGASISKNGYFEFEVKKIGNDTVLSKIIKLVEEAVSSKSDMSKLADKLSSIIIPIIFLISIFTFFIWLLLGKEISFAFSNALAVLVISCPCALGIATPISIMMGSYKGANLGIIFKSSQVLEILKDAKYIFFDKTGTLTEGKIQVENFKILSEEENLYSKIYSIEKRSKHHIAKSIVKYLKKYNIEEIKLSEYMEVEGRGIKSVIENKTYFIGNKEFMLENGIEVKEVYEEDSLIYFATNKIIAIFKISDIIRENSFKVIQNLEKLGLKVVMLTGDSKKNSDKVADKLKIKEVYSEIKPDEKYKILSSYKEKGFKVIMVGDGINDAPSLAHADIGITIGSATDIALERSDVVLMNNDILDIYEAIRLSKKVILNIKENLFWAFIYNIIGIPIATGFLGITLNPMFAALAMSLSSICVMLNAMRLNLFKKEK